MMRTESELNRYSGTTWWLAGVCALTCVLYVVYWTPQGVDDAWITYRYAENIAAGRGFVYNPGEAVLGTTTPLYTLLLAGLNIIGVSVPVAGWTIGAIGMVVSVILVFLLVRRLHSETAGLFAAGLLGSAQLFHRVATYGMETMLYVALILGAFLAYAKGREHFAAALAALCLLTRLDGAAVGVALLSVHLIRTRKIPWKAALIYSGIVLPWFLFSLGYFGSLTPNSMAAKRMQTGYTMVWWMPRWLVLEPRTLFAFVGAAAAIVARRAQPVAAALFLWGAMYAGAYTVIGIHRYDWYLTPLLAVLAAGAGIGVVAMTPIASWVLGRLRAPSVPAVVVTIGLAGVLIVPDAYFAVRRAMGDEGILGVERVRYDAAIWMRDSLPPEAAIATGGIGLVGYYTGRHIYDAMGLVTPGSMRIDYEVENPLAVPFPRFLPAVIEDYHPEYVFDGFWLKEGEKMPPFMKGLYTVVREWRGSEPGWPVFILYRRLDATASSGR